MYSKTIQKLVALFAKFPTVGPRTAARFVFYLLKLPKEEIETLISLISELKNTVKTCKSCFNSFEPASDSEAAEKKQSFLKPSKVYLEKAEGEFCEICLDVRRDKTLLCIIEKETDLISIEKTKKYKGLYFILGGLISVLKKEDNKKLRTNELLERVKNSEELREIIIALNPTSQGQATALYLERLLKPFNKKITRLGQGLPIGAELEYADEETLSSALESRR